MNNHLPAIHPLSRLVVPHGPDDQHRFLTFARALSEQPLGSGLVQLANGFLDRLLTPQPIHDVLCMFSSPLEHEQLALHREWRVIEEVNNRVGKPLAIEPVWAARVHDLQNVLLDRKNRDVLHFSGHGERGGVYFETADGNPQHVDTRTLVNVLAECRPKCLVFNACHSADALMSVRNRVPWVIAMQGSTTDDASIEFSRAFYAALARGRSVPQAFGHAFDGLNLHGHAEHCRPRLLN